MGFNIEQYEMYDNDSYSNGSGKWKAKFGIGDGKVFGKVVNKSKNAQFEAKKVGNASTTNADTALSKGAVCVKGVPIYTPALYLLTSKDKRTQNRTICRMRKDAKMKDDVAPAGAVNDNPATDAQAPANTNVAMSSGVPDATKSKTGMYVGIGIGVLAIAIVTIVLIKRK
jgi:hypothetical protein